MSTHPWLADRTAKFDSSGIRKVFDLAAKMANPINLSIGQPDFAVPDAIKEAAIAAIRGDKNGYSVTQGIAELRERLQAQVDEQYRPRRSPRARHLRHERALVLAVLAMVNPGDEVIVFDPYFVMYPALVGMVGGTMRDGRHVSRFSHRSGPSGRRDHAADEDDPAQQPGQPDRRRGRAKRTCGRWPSWRRSTTSRS